MSAACLIEPEAAAVSEPLPHARPAEAKVDFSRNVVCLMGLPFDQLDMSEAGERIFSAAVTRQPLLLSTVNVNFVVAARTDVQFRQSVLTSQLSLADGMPIVWASRLLGTGLPERVPGSSLFESLRAAVNRSPLKVYFFGAPDGVAGRASERVNASEGGVRCVGFHSPGYSSLDSMCSAERVAEINAAKPDFVVIALGAQKGQAWIERNRNALNAPVISHLGAVIGMTAGELKRAPSLFQRLGLEWLWRIKEEPHLWQRYWHDGINLLRIGCSQLLPLMLHRLTRQAKARPDCAAPAGRLREADHFEVSFDHTCGSAQLAGLAKALTAACEARCQVTLNFRKARYLDAQALGKLLLLYGHQVQEGLPVRLVGMRRSLKNLFRQNGLDYMLKHCRDDYDEAQDSTYMGLGAAQVGS